MVKGAHPSPLSAKKFFGSRPFTQIDEAVAPQGHDPIDWRIPDLGRAPGRGRAVTGWSYGGADPGLPAAADSVVGTVATGGRGGGATGRRRRTP